MPLCQGRKVELATSSCATQGELYRLRAGHRTLLSNNGIGYMLSFGEQVYRFSEYLASP